MSKRQHLLGDTILFIALFALALWCAHLCSSPRTPERLESSQPLINW